MDWPKTRLAWVELYEDRRCWPCLSPLRHLPGYPAQMVAPLPGGWRGRPGGAQPSPAPSGARGREFLAEAVQQRLMDWAIKFRPIPLRSPHLNGKVERTHRADREEFWDTVDPKDPEIEAKLSWLSAGGE
jgi:transposase InsO family protein